MKKKFIIVCIVLIVILGAVYAWRRFIGYETGKFLQAFKSPTSSVSVVKVNAAQWHNYIPAVGSMIANKGVEISSEVPGKITKIYFNSGDRVEKGEPIIQLNQKILNAQLANNIATLKYAKISYFRQKSLLRQNAVSLSNVDKALASYREALAVMQQTKAQLAETVIKAPFSGLIGIREVNLGEFITAGQTIVTLQALRPMFVDFSLPENVVAKIKKGYLIRVTTVAYPDQVFEGNIIAYSSALVNDTRSLTVRALVGNPLEKLLPGMFANINVVLPASKKVFLIPQIAVNYSPVGDFVYTVKNNLAKRQYITVGERRDDNISVLKGLTVDDNVVYAGQVKLRNNAKVIVEK